MPAVNANAAATDTGAVERLAYSLPQAAVALGLSIWGLEALVKSGQLRSIKIGARNGSRRILRSDLDEYLAERKAAAQSGTGYHMTRPDGHHTVRPQKSFPSQRKGPSPMSTVAHSTPEALHRAALIYAREGWPVFPCQPGGKQPSTAHACKDGSTDPAFISFCWRDGGPAYNVGIATGAPGPDVLDIDNKPGGTGWAAYERLKGAGLLAGALALVRTRSGGLHVYFRGTAQRNAAKIGGYAVDFRGAGGYVLAPPSVVTGQDGSTGRYALTGYRRDADGTFGLDAARELLTPERDGPETRTVPCTPGLARAHIVALASQVRRARTHQAAYKTLVWASFRAAELAAAGQADPGQVSQALVAAIRAADSKWTEYEAGRVVGAIMRKNGAQA